MSHVKKTLVLQPGTRIVTCAHNKRAYFTNRTRTGPGPLEKPDPGPSENQDPGPLEKLDPRPCYSWNIGKKRILGPSFLEYLKFFKNSSD